MTDKVVLNGSTLYQLQSHYLPTSLARCHEKIKLKQKRGCFCVFVKDGRLNFVDRIEWAIALLELLWRAHKMSIKALTKCVGIHSSHLCNN